jgi:predicted TIM-barrel fold metal-dependent hydrolase
MDASVTISKNQGNERDVSGRIDVLPGLRARHLVDVMSSGVHVPTAVIDADGHVVEPLEAWADLPEDHRPLIHRDASGYEHVVVGGQEILAVPLGTLATPGATFADPSQFTSLAEAQPGGGDPVARLADMDLEGIDQAVLYPSIGLYVWALADPKTAALVSTAYNDWLSGYCAADPARLFGAAMLPLQDPDAASRELRRAVEQLGFKAAFVRPNPCGGRSLSDLAYEPVWNTAEELGVPIAVHEGSSVIMPTLGSDRPFNPLILHAVSHSFEEMLAFAQLMVFGTLDRHPGLQFVFLESGGGWVPFWLERLDEQSETFGGFCPQMHLRPSEYFARQCAISFEVDETTLPALLPFIGHDRVVWGSDYPHHDATFPGAVTALRRTMEPLGVDSQARILGANARRIYGLPPRLTGPAAVTADYFLAITMRDTDAIRRLFAHDAVLDAQGTVYEGVDAIARFYDEGAFRFADLLPHPGALRSDDDQIVVDIDLHLAGMDTKLVDTFNVAGGQIRSLRIEGLTPTLQSRLASAEPR